MASPETSTAASVTVGGIGSSLSPDSVYAIACALTKVRIDSAASDRLSQPTKPSPLLSPIPEEPPPSNPSFLTPIESRAALVVLLDKLLHVDAGAIRPTLPLLIEQTLNLQSGHQTLDFGSPLEFLSSICKLNCTKFEDVGVTADEVTLLECSSAVAIGICAVLDHCSSVLMKLSDAVAALSFEAARADVTALDLLASGDGLLNKDETETARDLKVYLSGSKLIGHVDFVEFNDNPAVLGGFRESVRTLHGRTKNELKSLFMMKKRSGDGHLGKEDIILASISPLAVSVRSMSRASLGRAGLVIESIANQDLRSKVIESFEKRCLSYDTPRGLMSQFHSIMDKAATRTDYIEALHSIYESLVKFREILAWEAAVALFALEVDDSIEKFQGDPQTSSKYNGGNPKGEQKNEKKKQKNLGKGTSVVRQLLRYQLGHSNETTINDVAVIIEWARELALYFDPQDIGLDALLGKLKEIIESKDAKRLPKISKGTRDFGKEQMAIRERAFSIITRVFKMHGAVGLDTLVFELRETLMRKCREDSKLIYDIADQGGELCSLQYDLTVPFARYLALNNLSALKRYQIAKVYRRDNPSKGRYREFYQCDFDIAGHYETMEPDFEVIKVLTQLLDRLNIGDYEIKLNHRKLLDGMLEICGVSSEKSSTVCSSIDKLDKQSFKQIKKELVEEKGLSSDTADMIGIFVKKRGPPLEILSELKKEGSHFLKNDGCVLALNELDILFNALEKLKCLNRVVFDLSLAIGLDYYTGVIFEAVLKGDTQVGSIAAGGRYDNLVGMFSGKQVPAVGVSLGIERVFTILEQLEKERNQMDSQISGRSYTSLLSDDVPEYYSSPLVLANLEVSEVKQSKSQRTKNFSEAEDILIVSGWLKVSKDAMTRNEQQRSSFWDRILSYINENGGSTRSISSLKNRWSEISTKCAKFVGWFNQIERQPQSGTTIQSKLDETRKMYTRIMGKPFQFEHCWELLRDEPKWRDTLIAKKSKNSYVASPGSSSPATSDAINLEDDNELSANQNKPLDRKTSNQQLKNKKSKEGIQDIAPSLAIKEYMQVRGAQQEATLAQHEKQLALEAERLALDQRNADNEIMKMDTSNMDAITAKYFYELKMEIMAKRGFKLP